MNTARMWSVWAALVMCPLFVASCVGWSRHDGDFEKAPPEIKQDWVLVKQRCSGCHEVDRVFNKMASGIISDRGDVEWVVISMQSEPGANIPDSEVDRIINVLDWHLNR